jgi:type I restriction enzyme S subunit
VPVLLDTERKITDAGLAQINSGLLPTGTVLLSSRAPIGYLAIAEVSVAVNQGFIAMKARRHVSNLFLLRWSEVAHDEIISHANGSTFLEISKANFRTIRTVAPTGCHAGCIGRWLSTSANLAPSPGCATRFCRSSSPVSCG